MSSPNPSSPSSAGARAARLVVLALAALVSGCDDPGRIRTGPEVFRLQGCITCHGLDGHGTNMAPDLRGVARHWTREQLIEYFKNPPEYIRKDDRLREQKKRYSLNMPLYGLLRQEELENVADHVLSIQ